RCHESYTLTTSSCCGCLCVGTARGSAERLVPHSVTPDIIHDFPPTLPSARCLPLCYDGVAREHGGQTPGRGGLGGLCRGGGSGDCAPAPAGAGGLSDPQSAVSPGRRCPGGPEGRTPLRAPDRSR